jgi:hypothetical protein
VQRPHLQVAVDGLGGLRAERYDPWARALAGDVGQLPVQVDVGQRKAAQLRHPHFGVEQQPQHHLVAAAEEDGAVKDPGAAAADRAGLEQRGDLVVGEDRDGLAGGAGISTPSVGAPSSSPSVTSSSSVAGRSCSVSRRP